MSLTPNGSAEIQTRSFATYTNADDVKPLTRFARIVSSFSERHE